MRAGNHSEEALIIEVSFSSASPPEINFPLIEPQRLSTLRLFPLSVSSSS
jgi:hypothetical protein